MLDAQDTAVILGAASVAAVTVITGVVTAGLQIAAFIRAGRDREVQAQRDTMTALDRQTKGAALDKIQTHVNGMNATIEKLAYKAGGDAERENPTARATPLELPVQK